MSVLQLAYFLVGIAMAFGQLLTEKPVYDIDNAEEHFEEFIQKYDRHYASEEEKQRRFEIFKENLKDIIAKNEKSTYSVFDISIFTDLTKEEFLSRHTGFAFGSSASDIMKEYCENVVYSGGDFNVPEEFDWRITLGPVKNQLHCNSCWAFAAVGNIESQYALKTGKIVSLSEQQVQDCEENPELGRCDEGAFPQNAYRTVIDMGGIESERAWPYMNNTGKCAFDTSKVAVKIRGCLSYLIKDEEALKRLLFLNGPLAIGVDANPLNAHLDGVLEPQYCQTTEINHAVLLVGYGVGTHPEHLLYALTAKIYERISIISSGPAVEQSSAARPHKLSKVWLYIETTRLTYHIGQFATLGAQESGRMDIGV